MSTPATTSAVRTIEQLQQLPAPTASTMTDASRELLRQAFIDVEVFKFEDDPSYDPIAAALADVGEDDIWAIARSLLVATMARGPIAPDEWGEARRTLISRALLAAYADAGITPPAEVSPADLLAIYDQLPAVFGRGFDPETGHTDAAVAYDGTMERATGYALVAALSQRDLETAYMVADGPVGAGIGWGLHRQSFRQQHGIPADGRD